MYESVKRFISVRIIWFEIQHIHFKDMPWRGQTPTIFIIAVSCHGMTLHGENINLDPVNISKISLPTDC